MIVLIPLLALWVFLLYVVIDICEQAIFGGQFADPGSVSISDILEAR